MEWMGGVWGWISGKIRTCSDTKYDVFDHWKEQERDGFSLSSHGLRVKHTVWVKRGARLRRRKRTAMRLRERMEFVSD